MTTVFPESTLYLKPGTVISHAGEEYIIIGDRSRVNYEVKRVRDGKGFSMRRHGGFKVERHDLELLDKLRSATFDMGDIVMFKGTGKFGGKVGIVARPGSRYLIAVPGEGSIQAPADGLEKVSSSRLVAFIEQAH